MAPRMSTVVGPPVTRQARHPARSSELLVRIPARCRFGAHSAGRLDRLGLIPLETEVLCAAAAIEEETDIAWDPCLSVHAIRYRLACLEGKVDVLTDAGAGTRTLGEST